MYMRKDILEIKKKKIFRSYAFIAYTDADYFSENKCQYFLYSRYFSGNIATEMELPLTDIHFMFLL